ncbi:alanine racemase [Edaphobacter aggregans]|uniref:Alanine racemase n=1 Tax=Edaphobacter aggregans TaxID=570835 RepID=A0A3R9WGX8_9BACT|nr:alanine racemase [Edaphobacter aggregans]RSL16959.1 alanine racemase [Edaphobacter aggregans]
MKSWVDISERRLATNYRLLTEAASVGMSVLAVVKADAYGHGAAVCAPVLVRAGARWLGVTDAQEGAAVGEALAAAGVAASERPDILVMSGLLAEDADAIVQHRLVPVVWDRQQMEWLADAVDGYGKGLRQRVHLEIDTGMARQGVRAGAELKAVLEYLSQHPSLELDGVMTHFASAEVAGSPQTLEQRTRFEQAMREVSAAGLRPAWIHAGNSSTIDNSASPQTDTLVWLRQLAGEYGARAMVRPGLGLYGYCLPIECADCSNDKHAEARVRPELQPVMTWKTRVIGLREVQAGETVGYNATFVAKQPMRLALLPVGYADGLRRELSAATGIDGGWVMVQGQRAAIVGRVSMNLTVVDVSGITGVAVGDEVVLLGDGVTADDHALLAGTIAYEIVCGVRAPSRLGA